MREAAAHVRAWPTSVNAARNSSLARPARATKLPIRMNSGTTLSV